MFYKIFIRPVFFLFDAEAVHNFVLKVFSCATFLYPIFKNIYSPKDNSGIKINELDFKNRLGLAAGFDKNGIAIRFWEALGFSHVEAGTVTPLPQAGNNKPRIFRLKKDQALINRLGFNNKGADEVRKNVLEARKYVSRDFIIGINIGKNKSTSIKSAYNDYKICFEKLYDVADYFTINISSPNTEDLRKLHEEEYLDKLLSEIQKLNSDISKSNGSPIKCIFLKIAPDLNESMLKSIYQISVKNKIAGLMATNTTVDHLNLKSETDELGGLSGRPLKKLSDNILRKINEINSSDPEKLVKLIGVGGVFEKKDFHDKLNSGASLVQVYTGFIYEGPQIIKKILN